jgi:hypothetical protein
MRRRSINQSVKRNLSVKKRTRKIGETTLTINSNENGMTSLSLTNQIIEKQVLLFSPFFKKIAKRVKFKGRRRRKTSRRKSSCSFFSTTRPNKVTNRNITHNEAKDCQADRFEEDKSGRGAPNYRNRFFFKYFKYIYILI